MAKSKTIQPQWRGPLRILSSNLAKSWGTGVHFNRMILSLTILSQYTRVTERQHIMTIAGHCNVIAALCLVHTADKTRQDCLVLSAVWIELGTRQDCRRQRMSKLFCPVLKCFEDYWKQSLLVANSVYIADKTRQDSLVLSCLVGGVNYSLHIICYFVCFLTVA